jgi:type I restriction enzyme R subunit
MSNVGQPERATQDRVIALFRDELRYRYLGDWIDRDGNSNIEEDILSVYLTASGYTSAQISAALYKLRTEADNHSRICCPFCTTYAANCLERHEQM